MYTYCRLAVFSVLLIQFQIEHFPSLKDIVASEKDLYMSMFKVFLFIENRHMQKKISK